MTAYQIMQSKAIISAVPHKVKANAIKQVIENDVTNMVPATLLKTHGNMFLLVDENSAGDAIK